MRFRAVLLLAMTLAAACSGGRGDPPATDDADRGATATAARVTESPQAEEPPPPLRHDDHLVTSPPPPHGPLPTFNESPGCDAPAGIRGPYADREGDAADTQTLGGPWAGFFGRTLGEVRDHLVAVELPNAEGLPPVTVFVHDRVAPALQPVIEALERERAAGRSYPLDPSSVFSFRPATVPPKRYLSFHAIGAAIDINADSNPYREDNVLITDMPGWFVDVWVDAGWCWGGHWQQIKDPMHFSWMGPLHTPGYSIPEPIDPGSPAGDFTRVIRFATGLGPAGNGPRQFVMDMDRDGAPDAVRLDTASGGGISVTTAEAIHRFDTCTTLGPTPHGPAPSSLMLLADHTGDGRPDLWELTPEGEEIAVTVFTFASGFTQHLPTIHIEGVDPGASVLLGDHDLDGINDLHVVVPASPTTIEIRLGPDFDPSTPMAVPLQSDQGWRYSVGHRDADWVPDLYALSPDDPATLFILSGAEDFALSETAATAIGSHDGGPHAADLDGDGWDDLLFLDRDGSITGYLGGDRSGSPEADLTAWFLERGDLPWEYGSGCPADYGSFR